MIDTAAIAAAVLARLESDTGSGGLYASGSPLVTGSEWVQGLQSAVPPYIVYDVSLEGPGGEAFTSNGLKATVGIRAFVSRHATGMTALNRLSAINQRLYGNSGANSGVPSYGFHRWQITGISGWEFTHMRFLGQINDADEDTFSTVTNFEIDAITQTW